MWTLTEALIYILSSLSFRSPISLKLSGMTLIIISMRVVDSFEYHIELAVKEKMESRSKILSFEQASKKDCSVVTEGKHTVSESRAHPNVRF